MFTITVAEKDRIVLTGRLDASQTEEAARVLATVTMSAVVDSGRRGRGSLSGG